MLNELKHYFRFSSTEKKGVLFLSLGVVVLIMLLWFKPFYHNEYTLEQTDVFKQQVAQFYAADSLKQQAYKQRYASNKPKRSYTTTNYNYKQTPSKAPTKTIVLNTATTEELKQLKGIGDVLAERIIQYRTKLGGYHSIYQLYEVKGLKPEVIEQNASYISFANYELTKLDINAASFKELLKHPYLQYQDVKQIVRLRDSLKIISITDAQRILPDTLFTKLSPYLQ